MLADAIANFFLKACRENELQVHNFFLLVVTDVMITLEVNNHEVVIMADLFLLMWFNHGHFMR